MKKESGTAPAIKPGKLKNMFRSLQYRNYRLFFGGQSISLIGTWIQRIALPWLVYRLSGSPFLLGVVGFASQIPALLLSPLAGVVSDRKNRHRILIITQTLAMIQALILAALFLTGTIKVWHIIILGTLLGCVNAFDMPTRQAFVIEMVEKKEDLGNAIALNSSMVNSARLIGPSIAGVLIATVGEGICFLINGLSYLFVIASLLMMKLNLQKEKLKTSKVWQGLREGFSYAFGFPPIRSIILLLALISLMGMPYTILMPVFVKEILHGGAHMFGFFIGASGIGALVGAFYLASRKSVLGLEKIIPLATAVFGAGIIAFSFSRLFWMSLFLMFITGIGMIIELAESNTILQTIVDDDKRGRIMSLYSMAFMGTIPFGSLLAGGLASHLGADNTLLIGGISCFLGALLFAHRLPYLKKLIHPIYVKFGIIQEVATGIQAASELTVTTKK